MTTTTSPSSRDILIKALLLLALTAAALTIPSLAYAGGAGGNMPWDTGLNVITTDLTGRLAYSLVILGLLILGIMLVMVHDWSRFAQGIVAVIIAGSLMVGAATVAQALGITGAVV